MLKNRFKIFCILMLSLQFYSCGDGSGGDNQGGGGGATSETSEVSQAVTTINSKLDATADLVDANALTALYSLSRTRVQKDYFVSGMSSVWTTSNGVTDLYNDGNYTLKEWMMDEFNPNFTNSNGAKVTFVGRISNALDVFCFLGGANGEVDSTNLPSVGTQTVTITPAIASDCGDDSITSDMEVTITSTATTDTTLYDRLLSIELPGSEACPFKFYARINDSFVNVATAEDQNCDGRDQASQSVFSYDIANGKSRFFYISQAFSNFPGGFEVYRGYLDENADKAYVFGYYGGDQDGTSANLAGIAFTAVGKPTAGGTVAFSVKTIGNTIADDTYQACINPDTMDVDTDNSLACTVTGTDVDTPFTNVAQGLYDGNSSRSDIYTISETTSVGFTDETDMFN
ncbi:MAG: hypothetical protein H6621_04780 [Halobacteriovoraceae bacterium]|nr:hypothetical protein [Halobacteriovoraceae bacterium]